MLLVRRNPQIYNILKMKLLFITTLLSVAGLAVSLRQLCTPKVSLRRNRFRCNVDSTFHMCVAGNSNISVLNTLFAHPLESKEYQLLSKYTLSRRSCIFGFLSALSIMSTAGSVAYSSPLLSSSKQVDDDKSKIYQGFVQLNYLLDHWEEETTICGRSDNPYISKNGCERTPIKVMDYLGYKDISHPLFKADKTIRRLESFVPIGREDDFYDAIESWVIAAEEGSGMAYISSWGEANPGGGKDRVQLFIERAKNNVIKARDSLGTVIDIFDIQK